MDNADEGVIYISFGSHITIYENEPHLLKVLNNTISTLPYTILWKFDENYYINASKNVVFRKWFPQQDILGKTPKPAYKNLN